MIDNEPPSFVFKNLSTFSITFAAFRFSVLTSGLDTEFSSWFTIKFFGVSGSSYIDFCYFGDPFFEVDSIGDSSLFDYCVGY